MKIRFNEEEHRYYLPEFEHIKFTSVSKVIDYIKPKFDTVGSSITYSKKCQITTFEELETVWKIKGIKERRAMILLATEKSIPVGHIAAIYYWASKWKITQEEALTKWIGLSFTPEEIRAVWTEKNKISTDKGSLAHSILENRDLTNGAYKGYNIIQGTDLKECMDIGTLEPGLYTELIIPFNPLWLIGTADKIEIFEDKTFYISDYKSNETLEFKGKSYSNKGIEKLLPPVSHLDHCNGNHYHLQLSLYSYFLEMYGFKYAGGELIHIDYIDNDVIIRDTIPHIYMKKEVESILKLVKQKQS
jgi:hypothetical protein